MGLPHSGESQKKWVANKKTGGRKPFQVELHMQKVEYMKKRCNNVQHWQCFQNTERLNCSKRVYFVLRKFELLNNYASICI